MTGTGSRPFPTTVNTANTASGDHHADQPSPYLARFIPFIFAELQADYPQPDQLLQTFRDDLTGIRQFIIDKHIVRYPRLFRPSSRRRHLLREH